MLVAVEVIDAFLACHVVGVVRQHQVVVAADRERIHQRAVARRLVAGKIAGGYHVEHPPEFRIALDPVPRVVALLPQRRGAIGGEAEDENVVLAHGVSDLHVGAVERADGERTVQGELHVAGAGGFCAGGGNLLRKVGRGDDDRGAAHVVVGYEHHLEPPAHARIVVHHVAHVVDQLDDQFRHVVAGRGLAGEDHRARHPLRLRIVDEPLVQRDHVQHVQKLALVFVHALDLHIEQRVDVDLEPEARQNELCETLLVGALHCHELRLELAVGGELAQRVELRQIHHPAGTDARIHERGEPGVGLVEPAPRRDAIGDVDDTPGKQPVEVAEDRLAHELRVQRRDAVHAMAADDGQMGHAHALLAGVVDDRHPPQQVDVTGFLMAYLFQEAMIDLVDDLQVPRQHRREQRHRPGLERLGQQRVVGVRESANGDVPRLFPRKVVQVHEHAHQLGDGERRMGVVQLDRHLLRQFREALIELAEAEQNVIQRGADEEVLLLEPQFLAEHRAVARIQHLRQVFRLGLVLDRENVIALVEQPQVEVARGLRRPQPHVVDRVRAVARDGRVVGHRHHVVGLDPVMPQHALLVHEFDRATVKLDLVEHLRARELPRVAVAQPVVGMFDLMAVLQLLREHAVVVADAVAIAGQAQRRHRIEEAGGQPAQAAVTQGGIGLLGFDAVGVESQLAEHGAEALLQAEVQQAVVEHPADQELERQVVHALHVLLVVAAHGRHPALHEPFARHQRRRLEPVPVGGGEGVFADGEVEPVGECPSQGGGIDPRCVVVEAALDALGGHRVRLLGEVWDCMRTSATALRWDRLAVPIGHCVHCALCGSGRMLAGARAVMGDACRQKPGGVG